MIAPYLHFEPRVQVNETVESKLTVNIDNDDIGRVLYTVLQDCFGQKVINLGKLSKLSYEFEIPNHNRDTTTSQIFFMKTLLYALL